MSKDEFEKGRNKKKEQRSKWECYECGRFLSQHHFSISDDVCNTCFHKSKKKR